MLAARPTIKKIGKSYWQPLAKLTEVVRASLMGHTGKRGIGAKFFVNASES
jgi:hypothetical protein